MLRFAIGLVVMAVPCAPIGAQEKGRAVTAEHGMVGCVCPEAADVGVAVLKRGGTAVDAAVAVAFALAVTYPAAGNIGGGGFMLVAPPGAEPTFFDYRETAPAAVSRDTFVKTADWHNHKAVGVPGTVRGLELAHKRFGKLSWKDVVMPAVRLAEDGFVLDNDLASSLNWVVGTSAPFPDLQRVLGKAHGRDTWGVGRGI